VNRTLKRSTRRASLSQGRPIGFLTAWLYAGKLFTSKNAHKRLATDEFRHHEAVSYRKRKAARRFAYSKCVELESAEIERSENEFEGDEPKNMPRQRATKKHIHPSYIHHTCIHTCIHAVLIKSGASDNGSHELYVFGPLCPSPFRFGAFCFLLLSSLLVPLLFVFACCHSQQKKSIVCSMYMYV
jgi:hypothetical protein